MNKLYIILLSLITFFAGCGQNNDLKLTQQEKEWLKNNQNKIRVAPDPNWYPFEFIDNNEYSGFSRDYLSLMEQKLNLEFKIVKNKTWDQNVKDFKAKKVEILPSISITPQRKEYMLFSDVYYKVSTGIFVNKKDKNKYTVSDLKNKKVGVTQGYALHHYLLNNYNYLKIKPVATPLEGLKKVSNGRLDAMLVIPSVALHEMDKSGINNLRYAGDAEYDYELSFAVRKELDELRSILNKAISAISLEDKNIIYQKWTSITEEESNYLTPILYFSIIILIILIFPLYYLSGFFRKSLRFKIIYILIILLLIAFLALDQYREIFQKTEDFLTVEEQEWLREHPNIIFGPCPDYPPIDFVEPQKGYTGITKDFIEKIKNKINYEFKILHIKTWSKLLSSVKNKKVDFISSVQKTPQRSEYLNFTNPYINVKNVIIVRRNNSSDQSLQSLTNKKVAIIRGYAVKNYVIENNPHLKIIPVENALDGLLKVSFGEVDAMIADLPIAVHLIEKEGVSNLKVAGEIGFNYNLSFGVRKDWPILKNILNKALNQISHSEKKQIIQKWIRHKQKRFYQDEKFWLFILILFIFLLILAIIVLIWSYTLRKEVENRTKELEKAKIQAESANRAKTTFLANITHEIRTPLNAIVGFSDLLFSSINDKETQNYLKSIKTSANSLMVLINDILDLSKIEAGKLSIKKVNTNLKLLLNEIRDIFDLKIKQKGLNLFIDIDKKLPENLILDKARFRQILVNLVGNAVKFTESGYIKISIKRINSSGNVDLLLEIKDTGKGIPPDKHDKIFNTFTQLEDDYTRKYSGTGLGLTITDKLVKMMQGKISVESKENIGSTFKVYLYNLQLGLNNKQEPIKDTIDSINFTRKNVLVFDKDITSLELTCKILKKVNLKPIKETQPKQMIENISKDNISLIIMSIDKLEESFFEKLDKSNPQNTYNCHNSLYL